MSVSFDEKQSDKRKYETAKWSKETRNVIQGIIGSMVDREYGDPEIQAIFSGAGIDLPPRTYRRYKKRYTEGTPALQASNDAGRPRSLTLSQARLLVGFVLSKYVKDLQCTLEHGRVFLNDRMNIDVTDATVRNYYSSHGLTSHKMQKKASSATLTHQESLEAICTFIKGERASGRLGMSHLFATLDFTYLSHRKTVLKSYSPRGGAAPKVGKIAGSHTPCLLTLLWSDGIDRTPAILYTFDKACFPSWSKQKSTKRRKKNMSKVRKL